MFMLKITDLTFGFMDVPLYAGVNFMVSGHQKVGLVGPNGSGKSTLLKIISGLEDGYMGKVEFGGKLAYVPQEIKYDFVLEQSDSVKSYIDPNSEHADFEIRKILAGLELTIDLDNDPTKLSGGQKTKVAIARALLSKPDLLLLDEPTNFMDIPGKKWVMDFLAKYNGAVIVISHDLELMDSAIDKILAVDPQKKEISEFTGNYSSYKKLQKEQEELLKRQVLIKQKHIKQMEEGLRKMTRFTSAKGVRARVRQQRRIEKEKLNLPELPREIASIKIKLPECSKVGEIPVKAISVSKSFGKNKVLDDVNMTVIRGDRIALIGPNGAGKSTFLKILVGMYEADSGMVIRNPQLSVGYYSQEFETFDMGLQVIDEFCEKTKKDDNFARSFLGRFGISKDKVFQRVSSLSGGEKTRLAIAILTASSHNLLILDEPTTYLDVLSQRIILEALKEYTGTMLLVSHTPEFVKEIKPTKALLFPEGKLVFWEEELTGYVGVI